MKKVALPHNLHKFYVDFTYISCQCLYTIKETLVLSGKTSEFYSYENLFFFVYSAVDVCLKQGYWNLDRRRREHSCLSSRKKISLGAGQGLVDQVWACELGKKGRKNTCALDAKVAPNYKQTRSSQGC